MKNPHVNEDKIRLILADQHDIYREGLKLTLAGIPNTAIIGEARNGEELVNHRNLSNADVVILDIHMPGMDGLRASRSIMARYPRIKIICLSMFANRSQIRAMLDSGVASFLLKDTDRSELEEALKTVMKGQTYIHYKTTNPLFN
jgi:DNA-binding NarL/FixJ family response regulator